MSLSAAFPYRLRPILYPDKADIRCTWTIVYNVCQQPIISQLLTPIRRTLAGKKLEMLTSFRNNARAQQRTLRLYINFFHLK